MAWRRGTFLQHGHDVVRQAADHVAVRNPPWPRARRRSSPRLPACSRRRSAAPDVRDMRCATIRRGIVLDGAGGGERRSSYGLAGYAACATPGMLAASAAATSTRWTMRTMVAMRTSLSNWLAGPTPTSSSMPSLSASRSSPVPGSGHPQCRPSRTSPTAWRCSRSPGSHIGSRWACGDCRADRRSTHPRAPSNASRSPIMATSMATMACPVLVALVVTG